MDWNFCTPRWKAHLENYAGGASYVGHDWGEKGPSILIYILLGTYFKSKYFGYWPSYLEMRTERAVKGVGTVKNLSQFSTSSSVTRGSGEKSGITWIYRRPSSGVCSFFLSKNPFIIVICLGQIQARKSVSFLRVKHYKYYFVFQRTYEKLL